MSTLEALGVAQLTSLRRAAIYVRVSDDKSGRERSPDEQESDARRDCERQRLDVIDVYRDTVGASRHTARHKVRREWARLVEDIEAGKLDVVVTWSLDRATRQMSDFDDLAKQCREHAVLLLVNGRLYDVEKPEDEFSLGLDALLAVREVNVLRKRVLRALRHNAENGMPHGRIPWGYMRERINGVPRQLPDPTTAGHVVEAFERIANGEALRAVVRDFDARGVPAPTGGEWGGNGSQRLRQALLNRSYLGERVHHGKLAQGDCWPALVSAQLFERVTGVLTNPKRRTSPRTAGAARHLMSGLATCGVCDGVVTHTSVGHKRGVPTLIYRCKHGGHVGRKAQWVDEAIEQLIVARLSRSDVLAAWSKGNGAKLRDASRELSTLRARLDDAEDAMAEGKLSARAFGVLETKLSPRIAELSELVDELREPAPEVVVDMAGDEAAKRWAAADIDRRRAVVRALLASCVLLPKSESGAKLGLRCVWVNSSDELTL